MCKYYLTSFYESVLEISGERDCSLEGKNIDLVPQKHKVENNLNHSVRRVTRGNLR